MSVERIIKMFINKTRNNCDERTHPIRVHVRMREP